MGWNIEVKMRHGWKLGCVNNDTKEAAEATKERLISMGLSKDKVRVVPTDDKGVYL